MRDSIEIRPFNPDTDRTGVLTLPMLKNVPTPSSPEWKLVKCPHCGGDCWEGDGHRELIRKYDLTAWCTECALRQGITSKEGIDD